MSAFKKQSDLNFEECKSVRKNLLTLETLFLRHKKLLKSTMSKQQGIIDEMWVLSQRFLVLTRGVPCVFAYPDYIVYSERRNIVREFNSNKKLLHVSRIKMTASLLNLREKCSVLDRSVAKISTNLPSEILEGIVDQPIFYYIELFADLLKFFFQIQNKLNLLGKFLTIEDIASILEYNHYLEPDRVVNDYFGKCLHVCK